MLAHVTIIIPAHNSAGTLADTLRSVCAQSYPNWEAIIIENGSTDATTSIAEDWAAREPRIRVAHSAPGVSNARNVGLQLARHPWILFLDSDDWILPTHLEKLTARLQEDPDLDCIHGGWLRIGPDGSSISEEFGPTETDLFPRFARTCAITIHCGITRRSLIDAVGGFDPTLRTCEDWDLWQRIARMGCRFGAVREALACYRTRVGSASMNAAQLVSDSRKVIDRGYSSDPRVPNPRAEYLNGIADTDKRTTLLYTVAWAAGLSMGGGFDAVPLLDLVDGQPDANLDANGVAGCIFCCAMLPAALPTSAWAERFQTLDPLVRRFLEALEQRTQQKGLARSAYSHLARMALNSAAGPRPFTVGLIHAVRIDVTEPIRDLKLPETVERLHCTVFAENESLGVLELPVIDGEVPAEILADALAAEFAWPILERYFSRTLYPSLAAEKRDEGWTVRRGSKELASNIVGNGKISWSEAHEQIGWTVFLQEIWGTPDLGLGDFYQSTPDQPAADTAPATRASADWLTIEISDPLPETIPVPAGATAVLTVGGVPVTQASLPTRSGSITARALRSALTSAATFELCRAGIREAVLGRPLSDPKTLRERLAERATQRRADLPPATQTGGGVQLLPQAAAELRATIESGVSEVVLPRRRGACGTTASRRAQLPRSLWSEIAASRTRRSEPVLGLTSADAQPARIVYRPDFFWKPAAAPRPGNASGAGTSPTAADRAFGATFFEQLFQDGADPWHYETPYERKKYEQTLGLLPPQRRFGRVLELACAEGHFTKLLAPRADRLLATDFSPTALRRAAERCHEFSQIAFAPLDIVADPLPGRFDLIVCSEVLYYTGTVQKLRGVADKIARALSSGGYFLTAHAHLVTDEPHRPGFDWDLPFGAKRISDVFSQHPNLRLVRDLRTPLYRVQLFQKEVRVKKWFSHRPPERILLPQPTELPPHVAASAQWRGGVAQRFQPPQTVRTSRLPILMYHHVAPDGPPSQSRYRVTPDAFEAQLRWLAERKYRCVSLEQWRRAMESRQPLPGRCVAITFDDGYLNFRQHAWPLLQRFGFTATAFIPTAHVNERNTWDSHLSDTVPLMSWDDIRELRNEGVEFGSHTAHHPMLTSLSPAEIAREALTSRLALEENLGAPVASIAYPYGDVDRVVEAMTGACGYTFGLTCDERPCELHDRLTALPRLEIRGEMGMRDFEDLITLS